MEQWHSLEDLELATYSVSDQGKVRNDRTNRIMRTSPNQSGTYKVSLVRHPGEPAVTMGVAHLVARYFVIGESREFDTPINLDGDRSNNAAYNLVWRPRWFAINYHRQFNNDPIIFNQPIVCLDTDESFPDCRQASIRYGLLERDIAESVMTGRPVWPLTYDFRLFR